MLPDYPDRTANELLATGHMQFLIACTHSLGRKELGEEAVTIHNVTAAISPVYM